MTRAQAEAEIACLVWDMEKYGLLDDLVDPGLGIVERLRVLLEARKTG